MNLTNIYPFRFIVRPDEIRELIIDSGVTVTQEDETTWSAKIMYMGPASFNVTIPQPYKIYSESEGGKSQVKAKLLTYDGNVDNRFRSFAVWVWANRLEIGFAVPRIVENTTLGG